MSFPVNHLHNVLIQFLASRVPLRPIIARTTTILRHKYVFQVVQVRKRRRQYIVDDLLVVLSTRMRLFILENAPMARDH
jgi:hypothetical protein